MGPEQFPNAYKWGIMSLQKDDIVKFGWVRFRIIEMSGQDKSEEHSEEMLFVTKDAHTIEEGFNPWSSVVTHNPMDIDFNNEEGFASHDEKDEADADGDTKDSPPRK